jgi:septal ring factor EnvC (AmiA/AmiB activator)
MCFKPQTSEENPLILLNKQSMNTSKSLSSLKNNEVLAASKVIDQDKTYQLQQQQQQHLQQQSTSLTENIDEYQNQMNLQRQQQMAAQDLQHNRINTNMAEPAYSTNEYYKNQTPYNDNIPNANYYYDNQINANFYYNPQAINVVSFFF